MCKIGDIIVIEQFKGQDGQDVHRHSFVVISDKNGFIKGLEYSFISSMLTSFHNEEHKQKKLRFEENLEITEEDIIGYKTHATKPGFVKADQLYYFNKKYIKYEVIGVLRTEKLNELILLMQHLYKTGKSDNITTNLK